MFSRFSRTATAALVVALGLAAVPACKKKSKPTEPDTPNPNPGPAPNPGPGAGPGGGFSQRDPGAPHSPVFSAGPLAAGERQVVMNNLRQIGLAVHTYHDATRALPGGFYDASGKVGLSWRVALLPYLEQDSLFKEFKLNEPWDSEHNKKLIARMPAVFAPGRNTSSGGYTFLRGFTGPDTWLNPRTPGQAGQRVDGVALFAISDGLSNTILVAEAYDPVIWTKPDEMAFTPGNPPRLGGVFADRAYVLKADGSVAFLRKDVDPKMLAYMIQINDGHPVNFDE